MSDTTRTGNGSEIVPHINESPSLLNVIARAMHDDSFDVAKLQALLQMQRDLVSEQAQQAFHRAMSAAQGEMRAVFRDAGNAQTNSRYAKLETIDDAIRPIYTNHGFSLTFGTAEPHDRASIRVVCECAHSGGHVKQYELEAPPDTTGARGQINKTALHGLGSTLTYLRRYLTQYIFNVVLTNDPDDDDGNAGGISAGAAENLERRPPPPPRPATPNGDTPPAKRTARDVLNAIEADAKLASTEEDIASLRREERVRFLAEKGGDAIKRRLAEILDGEIARIKAFWEAEPTPEPGEDDPLHEVFPPVDADAIHADKVIAAINVSPSMDAIDKGILGSVSHTSWIGHLTASGRKDLITRLEAARKARQDALGTSPP